MYSMQELYLHTFSVTVTSATFISSIFSIDSSTNLSTNFFLHLQFLQSKYSLASHDSSHSHSQLLGFQIDPLSHTPLSIDSLHSHLYLSSFQLCLLLQTLASNLSTFTTYTFHVILCVLFH